MSGWKSFYLQFRIRLLKIWYMQRAHLKCYTICYRSQGWCSSSLLSQAYSEYSIRMTSLFATRILSNIGLKSSTGLWASTIKMKLLQSTCRKQVYQIATSLVPQQKTRRELRVLRGFVLFFIQGHRTNMRARSKVYWKRLQISLSKHKRVIQVY